MSTMIGRVFGDDMGRRSAAASIATNAVLMVLKLSVGVISGSIAVLSDGIDSLEDVIAAGEGYAFHGLPARWSGQVRHIDFHLTLPGTMTVAKSRAIADRVEARLEALYPGSVVTIHIEPDTEAPEIAGL